MHDAWYFSIASLPYEAKTQIAEHLRSADVLPQYRGEFDRIIDFMNRGASTDGKEICRQIDMLDRRRSQSITTVAPELAQYLGYQT
jgi:hypothetical protein